MPRVELDKIDEIYNGLTPEVARICQTIFIESKKEVITGQRCKIKDQIIAMVEHTIDQRE